MKKREFAEKVFTAIGKRPLTLHPTNPTLVTIEGGDTEKVKDLFKYYPDFKGKIHDRNNWTPVMYACR